MPLGSKTWLKITDPAEGLLVRSSDWKGTPCPHCGSTRLEKRFSTFAASVAGGGAADSGPACSGVPSSCGMCGTGRPHSH